MNDIVTVIGENTVIKGALQGDEDLTIDGRIEGIGSVGKVRDALQVAVERDGLSESKPQTPIGLD